jgi:hypothetical protein
VFSVFSVVKFFFFFLGFLDAFCASRGELRFENHAAALTPVVPVPS